MKKIDHLLGMDRDITRRDFIHDAGLAALGLAVPSLSAAESQTRGQAKNTQHYYPPTLTGLRGSHPGSFEVAHALVRQQPTWNDSTDANDPLYDLVVVGGGISGLAAAYFYRQQHGADARILILDNHDDFGGHAKRNEFHQGGSMRLAFGGAINLETPAFSKVVNELLTELGVDFKKLHDAAQINSEDIDVLQESIYFDAETYGRDVLVPGANLRSVAPENLLPLIEQFPLSDSARESLRSFFEPRDALAGLSETDRDRFLHGTSYYAFLRGTGGLTPEGAQIFMNTPHGYWGLNADNLSVVEALEMDLPGAHLLGTPADNVDSEDYSQAPRFPDGNASVARLLVRSLIPGVAPGSGMDDIVTANFDYTALDEADSKIRLRLNSTVINAANVTKERVSVSYVREGKAYRVEGKNCVLACYNNMIPYLCPDLPEEQKTALSYLVKHPMLVSNVLMKNARAAEKLGIFSAYCPGRMHAHAWLAEPIHIGKYQPGWDTGQAMVMQFFGYAGTGGKGLDVHETNRNGQRRLLAASFEDFERELRATLQGMLGKGGFDAAEDILAITVNRWPHGYAYELLDLYDSHWPKGKAPHEIGRQRFGRIAIANSDSGASAYLHIAIDQAWRAVNEMRE